MELGGIGIGIGIDKMELTPCLVLISSQTVSRLQPLFVSDLTRSTQSNYTDFHLCHRPSACGRDVKVEVHHI